MKFHWLTFTFLLMSLSITAQQSTILYFAPDGVYAGPANKTHQDFIPLADYSEKGIVTNWDDMIKSLEAGLEEKSIILKEKAVMAVVPTTFTKETQLQLCSYFLDKVGVAYYTVSFDAVCALRATGKKFGTAIMVGEQGTQVVPIIDNRPVLSTVGYLQEADAQTIAQTVYHSLALLNSKEREQAASAAIVAGEAVEDGMPYQINQQLEELSNESILLNFFSPPPMKRLPENPTVYTIFKGATTLKSLFTFEEMWISSAQYAKGGAKLINRFIE